MSCLFSSFTEFNSSGDILRYSLAISTISCGSRDVFKFGNKLLSCFTLSDTITPFNPSDLKVLSLASSPSVLWYASWIFRVILLFAIRSHSCWCVKFLLMKNPHLRSESLKALKVLRILENWRNIIHGRLLNPYNPGDEISNIKIGKYKII